MIKLTTSENKELIVTPEHKIAIWKNNKIAYMAAKDITKGTEVVARSEDIIIDEQDIINTYDERQQEQCRLYYEYLDHKSKNPDWGYKKIAKAMGHSIGKTRWWHARKHTPVPIQTANWLRKRGLIPLKIDNPQLPLISKVMGATFGDGGIFQNLNAIFLSSSNVKDTEEFSQDLQKIFGNDILLNTELREGGEYGHSWCMSNTNRKLIRFFVALQAPVGNKSLKELRIPSWIKIRPKFLDEFFGSLFGGELGVSKYSKNRPRIEFAITGPDSLENNRLEFLREIIQYLASKGIQVTDKEIDIRPVKGREGQNWAYRFLLSNTHENVLNFVEEIKINYSNLKEWKLRAIMDRDTKDKLIKYLDLRHKGLGAELIMKKLEISPKYLYTILNGTKIDSEQVEATT